MVLQNQHKHNNNHNNHKEIRKIHYKCNLNNNNSSKSYSNSNNKNNNCHKIFRRNRNKKINPNERIQMKSICKLQEISIKVGNKICKCNKTQKLLMNNK